MANGTTFVIIGASLAGAKAAEALREEGFDGRIVLVGEEVERPYERPPLSKGYLLGKEEREKIYVHPENWYAEHDVELRLGVRATAVEREAHTVSLADGDKLPYDKLLLTTGSSVRRIPIPGAELEHVHYLRRVEDSDALKVAFTGSPRVVVVGAGWIGMETAAAARELGAEVTIIEPQPTPLYAVLGPELGEVFANLHRDHDVRLMLGSGVSEIRPGSVVASDGSELPADVVIVGVGIRPNSELAEAAGLAVNNGIVVDELLRTTDHDIYAAGDVANAHNPRLGRNLRVEHWANALNQGPAAARSMLGRAEPFASLPYFFSDQYDLGMEYSGYVAPGDYDDVVYRGDVAGREFIAFWRKDGHVVAGMNVNVWDVSDPIRNLIRSGRAVDTARLTDPAVPIEELLSQ
jgi:3-phenylpropionate/trans-cinnamate dioxygenase ferredoxin reductase subunit